MKQPHLSTRDKSSSSDHVVDGEASVAPLEIFSADGPCKPFELSVLDWARERWANSQRLANLKSGEDRLGWLEDCAYWKAIVQQLAASVAPPPPEHVFGKHDKWKCRGCAQVVSTNGGAPDYDHSFDRKHEWEPVDVEAVAPPPPKQDNKP